MADGVAQDVHDRVLDPLQHQPVGLAIEPLDDHLDLLALAGGDIAHHLAEAAEDAFGRHHARAIDAAFEIVEMMVQ